RAAGRRRARRGHAARPVGRFGSAQRAGEGHLPGRRRAPAPAPGRPSGAGHGCRRTPMRRTGMDTTYFTAADPWSISARGGIGSALAACLRAAVAAPSIYNSQPWRLRVQQDTIELYADRERQLPVVDPNGRELAI